jgi:hypothetical protein
MPDPHTLDVAPKLTKILRLGFWQARRGLARSHAYPTTSRIRVPSVASGCMPQRRSRGTEVPLSSAFDWWQVQGSNLGRLSRRFTERSPFRLELDISYGL